MGTVQLQALGRGKWTRTGEAAVRQIGTGRAGLSGTWVALPGLRRVRVLWSRSEAPLTVSFPDGERTVTLRRGDWVAWDADRERVAATSAGPWEGLAEHWVGSAIGVGPALPVTDALDPRPGPVREWIVRHVGGTALLFVLACVLASAIAQSAVPIVLGTSFVHYLVYIATFAERRGVAFPRFVRDALLFKTLSMAHLGWIYLWWWSFSPISLAAIALGVGVSMRAAQVLGFKRTYFGWELGRLLPERIDRFPYGVIPHPMIVGAVIALLGVALQPELRAAWPWLVPGHVGLYLVHLAQEIGAARTPKPPPAADPAAGC